MVYKPISSEEDKQKWIQWLQSQVQVLDGQVENPDNNSINKTPEGDVATAKDLVGNLLATLSNGTIEIN